MEPAPTTRAGSPACTPSGSCDDEGGIPRLHVQEPDGVQAAGQGLENRGQLQRHAVEWKCLPLGNRHPFRQPSVPVDPDGHTIRATVLEARAAEHALTAADVGMNRHGPAVLEPACELVTRNHRLRRAEGRELAVRGANGGGLDAHERLAVRRGRPLGLDQLRTALGPDADCSHAAARASKTGASSASDRLTAKTASSARRPSATVVRGADSPRATATRWASSAR
jgi:hypothetical protein